MRTAMRIYLLGVRGLLAMIFIALLVGIVMVLGVRADLAVAAPAAGWSAETVAPTYFIPGKTSSFASPTQARPFGITKFSMQTIEHAIENGPLVQGVVSTAANGERIYYVARGVLTGEPDSDCGQPTSCKEGFGSDGRSVPQLGADNLYVYDSATGANSFVAELCSGLNAACCESDIGPSGSDVSLLTSQNANLIDPIRSATHSQLA